MMKKPVLPRVFGLLLLYIAVFIILVMIQFTKQGGFTQQIGDFVVSGHYQQTGEARSSEPNEYPLDGEANVFFGGMEFRLTDDNDDDSLGILTSEGERMPVSPDYMVVLEESVKFGLSDGTELTFLALYYGGAMQLLINASLSGSASVLELPYRPLRTSRIRDSGDGEFIIVSNGASYRFNNSTLDPDRRLLILDLESPALSYGMVPGTTVFNPENYIVSSARNKQNYTEHLTRWLDQVYIQWNRTIGDNPDEDTVIAYLGESVRRGAYKAALSGIPAAFLEGSRRSYESTVFLGRMNMGRESISAYEQEQFRRLSRLINEADRDFLKEPHVFEYLWIRGHHDLLDAGIDIVRAMDPADLSLDLSIGILEAYADWKLFRPNTDNPFTRFMERSCLVISEKLQATADGGAVYVVSEEKMEPEFNLRLGAALEIFEEIAAMEDWAGIGRSLILSILSLHENGARDSGVAGTIGALMSAGRIYRLLRVGAYQARAVGIGAESSGVWTWTAASTVQAVYSQNEENRNILDIAVSFPAGETHYMIIRGIQPFAQIRLYDIPFRTDPQFERYDSSGWSYSAAEQTLLLKMKHRNQIEHIGIVR
jgi:hypothetical protein